MKDGDRVVEPINKLVSLFEERKLPLLFTRDWHPLDHVSFTSRGGPWPPHCVKNTRGAEFYPLLRVPKGSTIISKASSRDVEAYSGFQNTSLAEILRKERVGEVYVAGLATDYCVKNTVLDGLAEGFSVNLIEDAVRGVNVRRTDSANAFRTMSARGVRKTTSDRVIKELKK